jgi:hypothetical protein
VTYFGTMARRYQGGFRWISCGAIVMSLVNLAASTATTAIVGGFAVAIVLAAWWVVRFVGGHATLHPGAAVAICVGVGAFLVFGVGVIATAAEDVTDKLDSWSFLARSGADLYSLDLVLVCGADWHCSIYYSCRCGCEARLASCGSEASDLRSGRIPPRQVDRRVRPELARVPVATVGGLRPLRDRSAHSGAPDCSD